MQITANYLLKKPEGTDIVNIDDITGNFDIIDTEIKNLNDNKVSKETGKVLSSNDFTSTEKTKLAGIATGANNYTHPSTHPASIIVQDASNRFVSDTEKSTWNGKASTAVATTSANGLMTSTDKSKLDGIASGAEVNQNTFANVKVGATTISADSKSDTLELVAGTNITLTPDATNDKVTINNTYSYTHPTTHPPSIIVQDASNRFVSDTEKNMWNSKAGTSVATTSVNGLMSSTDKGKLDGIETGANKYTLPTATSTVLGGVKSGGDVTITSGLIYVNDDSHNHTIANVDGLQSALDGKQVHSSDLAKFKSGTGTFTTRGTSHAITDAFCTTSSLVTISITGTVEPQGVWSVDSQAGRFVITSDAPETANITFDYYIQKAVG